MGWPDQSIKIEFASCHNASQILRLVILVQRYSLKVSLKVGLVNLAVLAIATVCAASTVTIAKTLKRLGLIFRCNAALAGYRQPSSKVLLRPTRS